MWVERSSVLTLDEAPPYYTSLIERWRGDQRQAWAYEMRAIAHGSSGLRELDLAIADFGELLHTHPAGSIYVNRGRAYST